MSTRIRWGRPPRSAPAFSRLLATSTSPEGGRPHEERRNRVCAQWPLSRLHVSRNPGQGVPTVSSRSVFGRDSCYTNFFRTFRGPTSNSKPPADSAASVGAEGISSPPLSDRSRVSLAAFPRRPRNGRTVQLARHALRNACLGRGAAADSDPSCEPGKGRARHLRAKPSTQSSEDVRDGGAGHANRPRLSCIGEGAALALICRHPPSLTLVCEGHASAISFQASARPAASSSASGGRSEPSLCTEITCI
jgi:hypothetical protein